MPARSTAVMWTNTSAPPLVGWINPKPFCALNHLTLPVAITRSSNHRHSTAAPKRDAPATEGDRRTETPLAGQAEARSSQPNPPGPTWGRWGAAASLQGCDEDRKRG